MSCLSLKLNHNKMLTNKQLKQTGDIIYYLALASYSSSKYKISHQKEITQVISES